jgi:hypothetical protein
MARRSAPRCAPPPGSLAAWLRRAMPTPLSCPTSERFSVPPAFLRSRSVSPPRPGLALKGAGACGWQVQSLARRIVEGLGEDPRREAARCEPAVSILESVHID